MLEQTANSTINKKSKRIVQMNISLEDVTLASYSPTTVLEKSDKKEKRLSLNMSTAYSPEDL